MKTDERLGHFILQNCMTLRRLDFPVFRQFRRFDPVVQHPGEDSCRIFRGDFSPLVFVKQDICFDSFLSAADHIIAKDTIHREIVAEEDLSQRFVLAF